MSRVYSGSSAHVLHAAESGQQPVPYLTGDDWYLAEGARGQTGDVKQVHLHFSDRAGQQIKYLFRQYAWWRLGRVRPVTVRLELSERLSHWAHYLRARQIIDPSDFTPEDYGAFFFWMHAKGLRDDQCERAMANVHLLLQTGQRLGWRVTARQLPPRWDSDPDIYERASADGYARPIPQSVYAQILTHALQDETDEITRSGILIQSQTGLRISEILSLRADCLIQSAVGSRRLVYCLKKTQRGDPVLRETGANDIVCEAVGRLRSATEALRTESGRSELFLVRNHGIRPPSQANWNRGRLHSFMKRWEIRDADGHIYELHSHQFRATYVTRQLLAGEPVEQIQHNLGHVTAEMTMRYMHPEPLQMQMYLEPYIGCGEVWQS